MLRGTLLDRREPAGSRFGVHMTRPLAQSTLAPVMEVFASIQGDTSLAFIACMR